jgi:hypothetical protein
MKIMRNYGIPNASAIQREDDPVLVQQQMSMPSALHGRR